MRRAGLACLLATVACASPRPTVNPADSDDWALDADEPSAMTARPAPATPPTHAHPNAQPPAGDEVGSRRPIFRGHRIDVSFDDVDLHDAFRTLAEIGGVSIVVADDVKGTISLRLRRVPWDQALDTIVKLERLQLSVQGGVYQITPR